MTVFGLCDHSTIVVYCYRCVKRIAFLCIPFSFTNYTKVANANKTLRKTYSLIKSVRKNTKIYYVDQQNE